MGTKKYRRQALIEAAILFSLFYLPAFLFQSGSIDPGAFNRMAYNIQLWVMLVPQILLVLHLASRDEKLGYDDFGIVRPSAKDIPFFLMAFVASVFLVALIQLILFLIPRFGPEEPFLWKLDKYYMLLPVFVSSMITGYSEELFFRSYLYKRLETLEAGKVPTVISANLLFAIGHMYEGPSGGFNAFVMGCFFSLLFIKKRNIHIPAIIHGLYNFTALLITLFS